MPASNRPFDRYAAVLWRCRVHLILRNPRPGRRVGDMQPTDVAPGVGAVDFERLKYVDGFEEAIRPVGLALNGRKIPGRVSKDLGVS